MRNVERKGRKYLIDEVLSRVIFKLDKKPTRIDFSGDLIKVNSHRLMCFVQSGTVCVGCGIKGSYFYKERHNSKEPFHFNLYAVDEDGEEILMTKDHKVPKSKGGGDNLDNYQTMCTVCNSIKDDLLIE